MTDRAPDPRMRQHMTPGAHPLRPGTIVRIGDEPDRWTIDQVTKDGIFAAQFGRPLRMVAEADFTVLAVPLDVFPVNIGDTVQHRYCQIDCRVVAFVEDEALVVYGDADWPGRWPIKDLILVRRALSHEP